MPIETELKLKLPASAHARLAAHPILAAAKMEKLQLLNAYYDTPELALFQDLIAVRQRRKGWQWLLTVKGADQSAGGLAQRREWEVPCEAGRFSFGHIDDKKLRSRLEALAPRFEPIFRTDFTRKVWLIEPQPGTRIEVALDRGEIQSRQNKEAISELELELLEGEPSDLYRLAMQLSEATPLHPEAASKAERGYRLFTGNPAKPRKAGIPKLDASLPPCAAFRAVALDCLTHLQGNEAGAIDGSDPEFVHQARVAIRRLRAALKMFAPVLPEGFSAAWNPAWRDTAAALGDARNWDVFIDEILPPLLSAFPEHPEVTRLVERAKRQQQTAQRRAAAALSSHHYSLLLLDFSGALWTLNDAPEAPPIGDFAEQRLQRRQRQVARLASRIAELDTCERHGLRISCKKLRYALEFFTPILASAAHQRLRSALAIAQDILGEMNDLATATTLTATPKPGLIAGWLAGRSAVIDDALPAALRPLSQVLTGPKTSRNKTVKPGR